MSFTVAVIGARGRLGQVVCRVVDAMDDAELVASLGSADDHSAANAADVVVDVTSHVVSPSIVAAAVAAGRRVLIGTSGWSAERIQTLRTQVAATPGTGAVVIPNFSLGSVLATGFAAVAARYFGAAEIIETHHDGKVDSPSGTAVRTAELMLAARGDVGPFSAPFIDQRARGQQVASIPVHSLRLPGIVAKQDVVLGGVGETLQITHTTLDSSSYEAGIALALRRTAEADSEVVVGLDSVLGIDAALGLPGARRAPDAVDELPTRTADPETAS